VSNQRQCYLCGFTEFNKRAGSVRDKPELEIFECASCGLVFLSSFDHIKNGFYENSKMHKSQEMLDIQASLHETARDDERRFQYLKAVLTNRSLLDFGFGAGGFLLRARALAAMAHGVEPETRLRRYYQSQGFTVFQNLSEIPPAIQGGGYDIITMFHVLEHISDPRSILMELSKKLTEDGQLIIEVPNASDALLELYQCDKFSRFTYWSCHLFLFTGQTLAKLANQAGLKVNYIKQVQRYPLSNHLYWLAKGLPGGHVKWNFMNSSILNEAYEKELASIGCCDTIIASFGLR
jgi:2-polyprenyl-3-methyl-5-hydroxy-6-metoxy-1,4-benzoquinol methylase